MSARILHTYNLDARTETLQMPKGAVIHAVTLSEERYEGPRIELHVEEDPEQEPQARTFGVFYDRNVLPDAAVYVGCVTRYFGASCFVYELT